MAEWRNWAGNVVATPARIERPDSIEAVQSLVAAAARSGQTVRVAGAGHSFAPICSTDGLLLDLSRLSGPIAIDPDRARATVYGGTRIHALGQPITRSEPRLIRLVPPPSGCTSRLATVVQDEDQNPSAVRRSWQLWRHWRAVRRPSRLEEVQSQILDSSESAEPNRP